MRHVLVLLGLVLGVALCPAQTAPAPLPSWTTNAETAWWTSHPTPDSWPKTADDLQVQLEADYKANGAATFRDSDFRGWFDHLKWVRLGLACPDVLADAGNLKTFIALGQDDAVSHLLVEKIDPQDVKEQALKNIIRLDQANADDLHEYAALGVAYALVWDQAFPADWPHPQVSRAAVPIGDLDIVQRFNFYVQSNRNKKLDLDLTQLSFESLKFLVDSQVQLSELTWAQQQNQISYTTFADAFFAITYDTGRVSATNQAYVWTYPSYKLSDILKDGGICIDQAYFAETVGKGRGIPTIRFTGFGVDGAHAWFGYLANSGKWELDCGRYENQSFPKGFAVDPQSWQPIDDSVLQNLFKNGGKNPDYDPTMTALSWANLHESDPSYPQILDDAKSIMPDWSGTWKLQAKRVDAGSDLDKKKQFYQDWITQFANYPDMKVEGQKRLYLALKAANDPDADGLLKDIVLQNRSAGFDLGIQAGADSMTEKLKAQDWDGARIAFEQTIRDFGQAGGLTLYIKVIHPYVEACLDNDKIDVAEQALSFTADRMTLDPDSQMGKIFAGLKSEVDAKKIAAGGH